VSRRQFPIVPRRLTPEALSDTDDVVRDSQAPKGSEIDGPRFDGTGKLAEFDGTGGSIAALGSCSFVWRLITETQANDYRFRRLVHGTVERRTASSATQVNSARKIWSEAQTFWL
jgi:hypothetical protein